MEIFSILSQLLGDPTTYSARVLNTSQDECPSDMQQETLIAEVKEDVRSILSQDQNGEYMN